MIVRNNRNVSRMKYMFLEIVRGCAHNFKFWEEPSMDKSTKFAPPHSGSEKGMFWKRGRIHYLEILENLELLEILEIPRLWKTKENPTIF